MTDNLDPRIAHHKVPVPVPGTPTPYVSSYGAMAGLPQRLSAWSKRLRQNDGRPFVGLGPIADLELVMQLLNLREFADYLNVHGTDEQRRWAAEIIEAQAEVDLAEALYGSIERVLPVREGQEYGEAIEGAARKAVIHDAMRAVLEQVGALAPDDTDTDLPALLRALLS